MADLLDFLPLYAETIDTVRERLNADVNAGLSPDDARWVDTREGSMFYDITQVVALEIARLWDALAVELPAAAFVEFAWGEYLDYHAAVFDLQRKAAVASTGNVTFYGDPGAFVSAGTTVSTEAVAGGDPIEFKATESGTTSTSVPVPDGEEGTAAVVLPVRAVEEGSEGNVGARAIVSLDTPVPGLVGATNVYATSAGAEEEADEALRERIKLEYGGGGGGTLNDYRRYELKRPGIGRVFASFQAPGIVSVVIMDESGNPVSPEKVAEEQQYLDPIAGQSKGQGAAGATIVVSTPSVRNVLVAATLAFVDGYSLDGGGGLVAVRDRVVAALSAYVDALEVGDDVVYEHVKAQLFVQGVYNVSAVTLNGGTGNVAVGASEVAQLDVPNLS